MIHKMGIEQADGNLTNFLLGPDDEFAMIDEDDIRVYSGAIPVNVATQNLANVAARLAHHEMIEELLGAYLEKRHDKAGAEWNTEEFWASVYSWKQMFKKKRVQKNISPDREFD